PPDGHRSMLPSRHHSPAAARAATSRGGAVAFMVLHLGTDDFDAWKPCFDADPVGREKAGAKGHVMLRGVADPNEVFVRVEFDSVEDAKAFRERLLASGALDRATVKTPPTVVDLVEN